MHGLPERSRCAQGVGSSVPAGDTKPTKAEEQPTMSCPIQPDSSLAVPLSMPLSGTESFDLNAILGAGL